MGTCTHTRRHLFLVPRLTLSCPLALVETFNKKSILLDPELLSPTTPRAYQRYTAEQITFGPPDSLVNKENSARRPFLHLRTIKFDSVPENPGSFKHLSSAFQGGAVGHKAEP
jgi:hypothetical protein